MISATAIRWRYIACNSLLHSLFQLTAFVIESVHIPHDKVGKQPGKDQNDAFCSHGSLTTCAKNVSASTPRLLTGEVVNSFPDEISAY